MTVLDHIHAEVTVSDPEAAHAWLMMSKLHGMSEFNMKVRSQRNHVNLESGDTYYWTAAFDWDVLRMKNGLSLSAYFSIVDGVIISANGFTLKARYLWENVYQNLDIPSEEIYTILYRALDTNGNTP